MIFNQFEDIAAWQQARELTKSIYVLTNTGNFKKDLGLRDQAQRSSVSIMLNIAEGFDSGSDKSFVNFLKYAFRSASEVEAVLLIALDLNYITEKDYKILLEKLASIKNLIGGLKRYLLKKK